MPLSLVLCFAGATNDVIAVGLNVWWALLTKLVPDKIVFVLGSGGNYLTSFDVWPAYVNLTLFLSGNGTLTPVRPSVGRVAYEYDPSDPAPTYGGWIFQDTNPNDSGSVDQAPLRSRKVPHTSIAHQHRSVSTAHQQHRTPASRAGTARQHRTPTSHDHIVRAFVPSHSLFTHHLLTHHTDREGIPHFSPQCVCLHALPSMCLSACIDRRLPTRQDVLHFDGEPLTSDLPICGPISAALTVGSSANDTDFIIRLVDQYPTGERYLVAEGVIRMRWRDHVRTPIPMAVGTDYSIEMDMWRACWIFKQGHRVGIDVTSSSGFMYLPNPNTGLPLEPDGIWPQGGEFYKWQNITATNSVVFGPSSVILPVVSKAALPRIDPLVLPNVIKPPDRHELERVGREALEFGEQHQQHIRDGRALSFVEYAEQLAARDGRTSVFPAHEAQLANEVRH